MKRRVFSLIALAAYLAMTLTGFIVGIGAILDSQGGADTSGIGNAIAAVMLALVGILAVAYGAFTLIPTLFKLFDVFFKKRALTVTCIVFDVILLLIHIVLLAGAIAEPNNTLVGMIFFCILPTISLIFNSLCLSLEE